MDQPVVVGLLLKTLEVLAEVSSVGSFAVGLAALNQGAPRGHSSREREEREGDEGGKAPENETI
jgi:hypothetical protein